MFNPPKKGKTPEWTFDLEKDLKDPAKLKKTKDDLSNQIQALKNMLRLGEAKGTFDAAQTLLQGYLAVQKIIGRIER